jgi:hypothetical protein
MAALLMEMDSNSEFIAFTKARAAFEKFLLEHKMFVNQLTVKHGSMAKGYAPLKEYFKFVLSNCVSGKTSGEIERLLGEHDKYHKLVKERPVLTTKAKKFSQAAKQVKYVEEALEKAFICELCVAGISDRSMHLDHIRNRSQGGVGTTANGRWLHPYCDSTYKSYLESAQ